MTLILSMLGLSMLIPVEHKSVGGGGATPPASGSLTWYFLGF